MNSMANRELFHVRKQLCTLQRQLLARPYTSEAQPPRSTSPAPDPIRFLQSADQAALRLTKQRLDTVTNHAKHATAQISAFPTTLQIPITTRRLTIQHPSEDPYETNYTPYQLGTLRSRQLEQPIALDNLLKKAEHINKHIQDLQFQPYTTSYGKPINPVFTKWQQEIREMNEEEKALALKESSYEEQARRSRLLVDSKRLVEIVKEVEAASRKYGGPVDVDAPTKVENPFASVAARNDDGGGQSTAAKVESTERKGSVDELKQKLAMKPMVTEHIGEQKETKTTAAPAVAKRGTAQTLLDLQRSLADSLRGGK